MSNSSSSNGSSWPQLAQGLKPGEHLIVTGGPFVAFYARAAGLEFRDTIAHAYPGGWETIMVFRKPLDGTVADNVLKYGTGGLNIDATRISSSKPVQSAAGGFGDGTCYGECPPGAEYQAGTGRAYRTGGRWPTNLVFTHAPECKRTGTKKVRGSNPVHTTKSYPNRRSVYQPIKDRSVSTQVDPQGYETVTAWDCVPGCPVKALDEQSGERTSGMGAVKKASAKGFQGDAYGVESRPVGTPMISHGDSGGASRFYPQFQNRQELLDWLTRLIG